MKSRKRQSLLSISCMSCDLELLQAGVDLSGQRLHLLRNLLGDHMLHTNPLM